LQRFGLCVPIHLVRFSATEPLSLITATNAVISTMQPTRLLVAAVASDHALLVGCVGLKHSANQEKEWGI
jgi:hypothetical protein